MHALCALPGLSVVVEGSIAVELSAEAAGLSGDLCGNHSRGAPAGGETGARDGMYGGMSRRALALRATF